MRQELCKISRKRHGFLYYSGRGMKQNKIRVFLIDDHPTMRDGVRAYLTSHSIVVVGEAADAPEALRKVKKMEGGGGET